MRLVATVASLLDQEKVNELIKKYGSESQQKTAKSVQCQPNLVQRDIRFLPLDGG